MRIVKIVQARIPYSSDQVLQAFEQRESSGRAEARLSEYVKQRVGICRERAFLLVRMLKEGGIDARVRYGEVYSRFGEQRAADEWAGPNEQLGSHAWVEAKIDGKLSRVDPNAPHPLSMGIRPIWVSEALEDGIHERRVLGSRSRTWIYVPTNDLKLIRN